MKGQKAYLNSDEKTSRLKIQETSYVYSKFGFLKSHFGLRPEKLHVLIATAGSGKSTLVRSITSEAAARCKTLVILSEETVEDFKVEYCIAQGANKSYDNLRVISELDQLSKYKTSDYLKFYRDLTEMVKTEKYEVIIYDNVTTSNFYGETPTQQSEVAKILKQIAIHTGCPLFIIAHTKAEINDQFAGLIEESHIRGSKTITNLAQFVYIMQRFTINNEFYPTIKLRKYRGYHPKELLYSLEYNRETKTYINDFVLPFKKFKEIFKMRNQL